MLDIKYIVDNKDEVIERLNTRGKDYSNEVRSVIELYEQYKQLLVEFENNKARLNEKSKLIGLYKREGKDVSSLLEEVEGIKVLLDTECLKDIESQISCILDSLPNLPHESTPIGNSEDDNIEVEVHGEIPIFDFEIKSHDELTDDFEFERAVRISKSRFVITKNLVAKLERALMNYMLDTHGKKGYIEYNVPQIVNENTLYCSGQLPKFSEDLFKLSNNNNEGTEFNENDREFYLVPTAEVVLANIHQGEILNEEDLPFKYMAYTQCFRKEAGSAGRDTKGIIRLHQFGKVELFKYCTPENSYDELEKMVKDAASILDGLKLPYRILDLCTADISAGNAKTFDLEVWLPSQNRYVECSSCSNTDDFQARRTGVRFKRDNKMVLPHLLNGSGMATGRVLAAILENYQNEDGTVTIPEVLKKYINN